MDMKEIEQLFTHSDGRYGFARWGRAIAPVVFGVEDETLTLIKGAIDATCQMAGHEMTDGDAELGSNFMWFFFRDWQELLEVPRLDEMVDELPAMVSRLDAANANQYRVFRFDKNGAIKACFVFLRMDDALAAVPADRLVLTNVLQSILMWSDQAFGQSSPLALANGVTVIKPEIAQIISAAYDPVMPSFADDPSHALRLMARMAVHDA